MRSVISAGKKAPDNLRPGLADLIAAVLLCTTLYSGLAYFASDPGLGWHLANGLEILQSGRIPLDDPFLYHHEPRAWVSDQWLSDVVFAALYLAGGWPLLYAGLVLLFFYCFFAPLRRHVLQRCGSTLAALAACLAAFKMSGLHFIARPTLFSFLFFIIVLRIATQNRQPTPAERAALAMLFAVWANLHPAFVIGLAALALRGLADLAGDASRARLSLVQLGACTAATLINPWGIGLHESIIYLGTSQYFLRLNSEWLPLQIGAYEGILFCSMSIFAAIYILRGKLSSAGRSEAALVILLGYLTLEHVRFAPYFAAACAAPAAGGLLLSASILRGRPFKLTNRAVAQLESYELRSTGGMAALIFGAVILIGSAITGEKLPLFPGPYGPSPDLYPYGTLKAAFAPGRRFDAPQVLLATPNWGGFITLYARQNGLEGEVKAVIDDRNTLLGEEFYRKFFSALVPNIDFPGSIARFSATHLLLSRESQLAKYCIAQLRWKPQAEDSISVLFDLRNLPKPPL